MVIDWMEQLLHQRLSMRLFLTALESVDDVL